MATDATALPVDERVSVRFPGDRVGSFDPSGWDCPRLRRQLSAEIVWQCRPGGRIGAPGTLQTYASACRRFLSHLATTRDDELDVTLATLAAADVDRFEATLGQLHKVTTAYSTVTTVVALLRDA
ncbi:MAG: hypothetical protein ACRDJN_05350, partial [Chloroflexota bacterium]